MLATRFGRRHLTHTLLHQVEPYVENITSDTLEGFFPFHFTLPNVQIIHQGQRFSAHQLRFGADLRYNPFLPFLRHQGGQIAYVKGLGLAIGTFHPHHDYEIDAYYLDEYTTQLNTSFYPHTTTSIILTNYTFLKSIVTRYLDYQLTLHRDSQTHLATLTFPDQSSYAFQEQDHTWDLVPPDQRPLTLFTPFRRLQWIDEHHLAMDVGRWPILFTWEPSSALSLQHGPLQVHGQGFPFELSLTNGTFRDYHCLELEGEIESLSIIRIDRFKGLQDHHEFEGKGTFHPFTQELRLNVDIVF